MRPSSGRPDESRHRSCCAVPEHVFRSQGAAITSAPRRHFRLVRQFGNEFAGLLVIFADVAYPVIDISDVRESLTIHGHAVSLRRVEVADYIAFLIEVDHRRRSLAAIRNWWVQLGLEFDIGQIVGAIESPDVIVLVHRQPGDTPHFPFVR